MVIESDTDLSHVSNNITDYKCFYIPYSQLYFNYLF